MRHILELKLFLPAIVKHNRKPKKWSALVQLKVGFRLTILLIFQIQVQALTFQARPEVLLTTGVTALLLVEHCTVLVGTKSGKIFVSEEACGDDQVVDWTELIGYASKFPIFSLAKGRSDGDDSIFAGGGDRFVSVWNKRSSASYDSVEQLGPHTGWVKDILYQGKHRILYSIGCNCIESWNCSGTKVEYISKRTIENSPALGATLSSDLLCLCAVGDDHLISGGVDGRVHLWSCNPKSLEPIYSMSAHGGRVNSLAFSSSMRTIFSVGHDGKIIAYGVSSSTRLSIESSLEVMGSPRISTAYIVQDGEKRCTLAMGTTDGQIILVTAEKNDGGPVLVQIDDSLQLDESPMIYALCDGLQAPGGKTRSIMVGHATGLLQLMLSSS